MTLRHRSSPTLLFPRNIAMLRSSESSFVCQHFLESRLCAFFPSVRFCGRRTPITLPSELWDVSYLLFPLRGGGGVSSEVEDPDPLISLGHSWFLHRGPHTLGCPPSWANWGGRSASCGIHDGAGFWLTAKHFVHEAICVGGISGDTGSKQGPFLGRLSPSLSSSSSRSAEPHLFLK